MIWPFDVGVLLEIIDVLLLWLGRDFAELVPSELESAFDFAPFIPYTSFLY